MLVSAGVFDMFVPRVFGGGEMDVATGVRVLEELSKADGSTGWIAMIGATTGVIRAYLPRARRQRNLPARHNHGRCRGPTWDRRSGERRLSSERDVVIRQWLRAQRLARLRARGRGK